jgi:hypothetical protein
MPLAIMVLVATFPRRGDITRHHDESYRATWTAPLVTKMGHYASRPPNTREMHHESQQ